MQFEEKLHEISLSPEDIAAIIALLSNESDDLTTAVPASSSTAKNSATNGSMKVGGTAINNNHIRRDSNSRMNSQQAAANDVGPPPNDVTPHPVVSSNGIPVVDGTTPRGLGGNTSIPPAPTGPPTFFGTGAPQLMFPPGSAGSLSSFGRPGGGLTVHSDAQHREPSETGGRARREPSPVMVFGGRKDHPSANNVNMIPNSGTATPSAGGPPGGGLLLNNSNNAVVTRHLPQMSLFSQHGSAKRERSAGAASDRGRSPFQQQAPFLERNRGSFSLQGTPRRLLREASPAASLVSQASCNTANMNAGPGAHSKTFFPAPRNVIEVQPVVVPNNSNSFNASVVNNVEAANGAGGAGSGVLGGGLFAGGVHNGLPPFLLQPALSSTVRSTGSTPRGVLGGPGVTGVDQHVFPHNVNPNTNNILMSQGGPTIAGAANRLSTIQSASSGTSASSQSRFPMPGSIVPGVAAAAGASVTKPRLKEEDSKEGNFENNPTVSRNASGGGRADRTNMFERVSVSMKDCEPAVARASRNNFASRENRNGHDTDAEILSNDQADQGRETEESQRSTPQLAAKSSSATAVSGPPPRRRPSEQPMKYEEGHQSGSFPRSLPPSHEPGSGRSTPAMAPPRCPKAKRRAWIFHPAGKRIPRRAIECTLPEREAESVEFSSRLSPHKVNDSMERKTTLMSSRHDKE